MSAYKSDWTELKNLVAALAEIDQLKAENEALRNVFRPLLAHWDDLKAGESLNVDAARAATGKGEKSEIHHTSWALVHEPPPICANCGVKMFTGLTPQTLCNRCKDD